ncbi:hypothetical protein KI387_019716, partial [Taxus chinensis]
MSTDSITPGTVLKDIEGIQRESSFLTSKIKEGMSLGKANSMRDLDDWISQSRNVEALGIAVSPVELEE